MKKDNKVSTILLIIIGAYFVFSSFTKVTTATESNLDYVLILLGIVMIGVGAYKNIKG